MMYWGLLLFEIPNKKIIVFVERYTNEILREPLLLMYLLVDRLLEDGQGLGLAFGPTSHKTIIGVENLLKTNA